MNRIIYDNTDLKIFNESPEGRAYLEYNNTVGGEPFNECVYIGDIDLNKQYGGIIGLYSECIRPNKTWQEILNAEINSDRLPLRNQ